MKKDRTELTAKILVRRFRDQGGVTTLSNDGHMKLYKRVERPGQDPGYVLLGKLSVGSKTAKQSADKRTLIAIRNNMRRNGFDV